MGPDFIEPFGVHGVEIYSWSHPPFFKYVERWMTLDDSPIIDIIEQQTGKDYRAPWAQQGQAWDRFVENIRHAYYPKKRSP